MNDTKATLSHEAMYALFEKHGDTYGIINAQAAENDALRRELRRALLEAHALICGAGLESTDQATILAGIWTRNFKQEPIG